MATCLQFEKRGLNKTHPESPLTPELKEFIDRAIVPILVKQALAEIDLADEARAAAHSVTDSIRSTAVVTLRGDARP